MVFLVVSLSRVNRVRKEHPHPLFSVWPAWPCPGLRQKSKSLRKAYVAREEDNLQMHPEVEEEEPPEEAPDSANGRCPVFWFPLKAPTEVAPQQVCSCLFHELILSCQLVPHLFNAHLVLYVGRHRSFCRLFLKWREF